MSGIKIPIGTDNRGLDAGVANAQSRLRAFQSVALRIFAAVGAATGMLRMFTRVADQIDRVGKLAAQTGLGARTLQQLSRLAEKAGLNVDVLARSYGRFNRELQLGATTLTKDALNSVGLQMEDLQGKTPEETLQRLARAFNDIDDPARKSAVAMQIFGRQGGDMISLFEAMAERAGEVSTLSDQQVRDVERMNDAWTDLKHSVIAATAAVVAFFAAKGDPLSGQRADLAQRLIDAGMDERAAFSSAQKFEFTDINERVKEEQEMQRQMRNQIKNLPRNERAEARNDPFLNRTVGEMRQDIEGAEANAINSFIQAELAAAEKRIELERERRDIEAQAESAARAAKLAEIDFEIELLALSDEKLKNEMQREKILERIAAAADQEERARAELDLARLDAASRTSQEAAQERERRDQERDLEREKSTIERDMERRKAITNDPRSITADSMRAIGGGGGVAVPNEQRVLKVNENQLAELKAIKQQLIALQMGGGGNRRFK